MFGMENGGLEDRRISVRLILPLRFKDFMVRSAVIVHWLWRGQGWIFDASRINC